MIYLSLSGFLSCFSTYLWVACCLHSQQGTRAEQSLSLQADWMTEEYRLFPHDFHSSQCRWKQCLFYYDLPESMNSEKQWRQLCLHLERFFFNGKVKITPKFLVYEPKKINRKSFRIVSETGNWRNGFSGKQGWQIFGPSWFGLTNCICVDVGAFWISLNNPL